MVYATTTQLTETIGIKSDIPSWDIGNEPSNEEVGTGNGSKTIFYLDYKNILANSYTLYYGSDASATDTLIETTHYALDKDTGKITLTTDGVTLLSTDSIFAKYSYVNNGMSDSYLTTVLNRATTNVENNINSKFTDGTATNPNYPVETEIKSTNGMNQDRWITEKKPLIDITSSLDGAITSTDNSLSVTAGDGSEFPTSGYLIIESEVISYTGISTDSFTGLSRGQLGTTATTHADGKSIHTTLVFVSDTTEGTSETYTIQAWNTDIYATSNGLTYRYKDVSPDILHRSDVENRFKIIYYYGYNTIPEDIIRLTILYAKTMLSKDTVSKSSIAGRNEFRPELIDVDRNEINDIVNKYIVLPLGNT